MRSRLCVTGLTCCLLLSAAVTFAQPRGTAEADAFGRAVQALRQGDDASAHALLTQLTESGSSDPVVWYFRGAAAEQQGLDGTADFQKAAQLELKSYAHNRVNRSLEPIQGPLRLTIESIRRQARVDSRPADTRLAASDAYRRGLAAMQNGDTATAIARMTQAIETGTQDPRPYYLRAVLHRQAGNDEAAVQDLQLGIANEQTPRQIAAVDRALEDIQGSVRVWLETTGHSVDGNEVVTRSQNRRSVVAQERERTQQLLAADASEQERMLQAQAEAERQRIEETAERIRAAEQAAAEQAELLAAREAADAAATPMPEPQPELSNIPPPTATAEAPDASVATRSSKSGIDVSWLPPQNEVLVYVRLADFLDSEFLKPVIDMPQVQQALTEMTDEAGFSPADVESVTIGLGSVGALVMQAGMQAAGPPNPDQLANTLFGTGNAMIVVRTRVPLDYDTLNESAGGVPVPFNETTYYQMPPDQAGGLAMAAWPVDAQTYLFTSEAGIRAAIQRGPGAADAGQFGFIPPTAALVVGVDSPNLAAMTNMIPVDQTAPPTAQQLVNAIRGNLNGAALTVEVSNDLELSLRLKISDRQAGQQAGQALTTAVQQLQQMFPGVKPMVPPPLQDVAQRTVDSASAGYRASVASFTLTIPADIVPTLRDNSEQIFGPLLGAAMGMGGEFGPGGPGPGGPGGFTPPDAAQAQFPGQPPGRGPMAAAAMVQQRNRMKQIALAFHEYHDQHQAFPLATGGTGTDGQVRQGLSWRVYLLPFLEQQPLFDQFKLDEPWDSEHNLALVQQMPDIYQVPGVSEPGKTSLHVFTGAGTPLGGEQPGRMRDIQDGSSNTLLFVLAGPDTAQEWTRPGGLPFTGSNTLALLGSVSDALVVAFIDGSVQTLQLPIDETLLNNLIQHADGNPIPPF